jgi:serine phosphatase RsbU (regulator of sigma subunit)/integral membrane sensor domain MASE1/anti-sigma regulatory factor (Ser/Thr protein kinase)
LKSNSVTTQSQPTPETTGTGKWEWATASGRSGVALLFLLVAVAYGVGSRLAFLLIESSGLQGVFFIPAGITVAIMIRLPRRLWGVVLLAAGITELTMDLVGGYSVGQSIGFAVANIAEPFVGAAIVTDRCGPLDLARRRHVLWFTLGAVLAGPALGAALGAGTDFLAAGDDFGMTFAQWWLGDALGVVLVGGAILAWGSSPDRMPIISGWGATLLGFSILATIAILTLTDLPLIFLVLVLVVLAGALFGPRATSMTSLSVAITVGIVLALDSGDLISGMDPGSALLIIKLQIGTFALAGLAVAAEAHEREIAVERVAHARVETELLERERQREHDLAVQVQRGLLPDRHVDRPGFDIAARHETAEQLLEVGGDWYDVISLPAGRFGLVVGDIVGHGIRAMTSMGRLRTALSALAMHADDPASALIQVDEFVGGPDGTQYATVFYAIVDPAAKSIRYASAGHPPALLIGAEGEVTWLDSGQSEPLSGAPNVTRKSASAGLTEGVILILYTDGLIERRGESLNVGLARLGDEASALRGRQARDICEGLIARLAADGGREDDVVVLTVKADSDSSRRFQRTYPAQPMQLSHIRAEVRAWMDEHDLPATARDDLLIALGETTSNAVRHAFGDGPPGTVRVSISIMDGFLEAEVSDDGRWEARTEAKGDPGLGLKILRSAAERLQIDPTSSGTTVTFSVPLEIEA